ncbi:MAG: beta-carotene 15,15'-dioxygenase, Brp/Blh family [Saprospiraceae bacterium]
MEKTTQYQNSQVDYFFAGSGASAILLILSMERRGLLLGKRIAIADPVSKHKNDKTYCFWGNPRELPASHCQHLSSHQWEKVSINRKQAETLLPFKYFHISSIDLYTELHRLTQEFGMQLIQSSVNALDAGENGVLIQTDQGNWQSNMVFDSRPPKFKPLRENQAHLLQSFIGFVIDTDKAVLYSDCIDLMDFNVDQQGWTQFVYVLPFGPNKLLVELTRFGNEVINLSEAEPILNQYITERFGRFKVTDTEVGCIPMSSAKIDTIETAGVIHIGGRAGAIKPSTGYAFKNMFIHGEKIADCLQKGIEPIGISSSEKFKFYDRLLLLILSIQPYHGKPIFQALFQKNRTSNVLQFLDEKTSLMQDLKILLTLPIRPFLGALWTDILVWSKGFILPLCILVLTISLWFLHTLAPDVFAWVNPTLLALGLFSVGIPHGAIDHLLANGDLNSRIDINFVFRYLTAAAAYLILWLLYPNLALFFFLIYSVWHFGQADVEEWRIQSNRSMKNWIWGSILLGTILCGHVAETNQILANMSVFALPISEAGGKTISMLLILFYFIWGFRERKAAMLLSCCMLAISIQLPLLTSFGLYFIGQHSINGWSHLKRGLNTDNISLFIKALPFTAGAFLLFAFLIYSMITGWLVAFNSQIVTAFFVFISCISFPHVITMNGFYQKFFPSTDSITK